MGDLNGWARTADTDGITFHAPDGESWLAVRPRRRGTNDVHVLLDRTLSRLAARVAAPPTIEHGVAADGERCVELAARLAIGDRVHDYALAVAGDDPFVQIDALGGSAVTLVAPLVRELGTGLGATRRRRFLYEPPAGWAEHRGDEHTTWTAPDARITIFDARPFRDDTFESLDRTLFMRMPAGFACTDEHVEDFHGDHGLSGRLRIQRDRTRERVRFAAAFADDEHAYLAHAEAADHPAQLAQVRRILASFRPLAAKPATVSNHITAMWTD